MRKKIKLFIAECLRLLWIIYFRPNSFLQMIGQLDRRHRWQVMAKSFFVVLVAPLAFITIAALCLNAVGVPFYFIRILYKVTLAFVIALVFGFLYAISGDVSHFYAQIARGRGESNLIIVGLWFGYILGYLNAIRKLSSLDFLLIGFLGISLAFLYRRKKGIVLTWIGFSFSIGIATAVGNFCTQMLGGTAGSLVIIGYFKLFLLPIEVPNTLWTLWQIKRRPNLAAHFLCRALAYLDEGMRVTQPFLKALLVRVGELDKEAGMEAIVHLTTNSYQLNAAEAALLKLGSQELLSCRIAEEIAKRGASSYWLSSEVSKQWPLITEAYAICRRISAEVAAALSTTSNHQKLSSFHRACRQLDKLRQFKADRRQKRAFTKIAQQWLEIVNKEIDRLTEEERTTDRIPNPYTPLDPLSSDSEIFFGRADVYQSIEEHFLREGRKATIVLYGQRRIGKSSLLRNLETRLTTNLIPVYVDMQRSALVESTGGLLFNLADAINRELARRGIHLKQPELGDYAAEPFIVFGKFLDEVEEAIHAPENRIILALDEFEVIEQKLVEGKVSSDLLPFLRNMMQHRQGFSLIFAGGHALDEMISDSWIQYFNTAVPLRVSYLDEASARKLITQPIEDFLLNYEPEAVDLLIEQTCCHPCLIQLACQTLVDMKNEQRSRHATVEDIRQALKKSLDNDYALRSLWDWIPENERPLLLWLVSKEPASIEQMARALLKSEAEMRGITEHLVKAEVLQREGDPPVYRFQVPLFRQWVARHTVLKGMESGQRQVAD
ncbi:MAG: AAA family ATPase [Blastocatellia bacterium]